MSSVCQHDAIAGETRVCIVADSLYGFGPGFDREVVATLEDGVWLDGEGLTVVPVSVLPAGVASAKPGHWVELPVARLADCPVCDGDELVVRDQRGELRAVTFVRVTGGGTCFRGLDGEPVDVAAVWVEGRGLALPARRQNDCAETITAAPSAEALALAAEMSCLRTTVACLGGALFGFGGLS